MLRLPPPTLWYFFAAPVFRIPKPLKRIFDATRASASPFRFLLKYLPCVRARMCASMHASVRILAHSRRDYVAMSTQKKANTK